MKKTLAIILAVLFASTPCYGQFVTGGGGGGTSLSGGTQYYLTAWNGADSVTKLAALGSAGNPLISAGAGALPAWLAVVLAGGTNTFSITNGTASLDVAAGATLNIDKSFQVATGAVVLNGNSGGSSVLTLPNQTIIVGTLTDGKWCSYASSGTALTCTQDAPSGSGDVTDVGNCSSGNCFDGSSDGGTQLLFYDAQGATTLVVGDNGGAVTVTLPTTTSTLATVAGTLPIGGGTLTGGLVLDDGTGASPSLTFTDATDETAVFEKVDSGYLTLTTLAADGFNILTGNLKVGNGAPGQTINGEDAYIEGLLEVDGVIYADGGITGAHNGTVGASTPAAGAFTILTASTSLAVTAATTTGGYIRLLEGTDNGTDYSVITGAANAGANPSFTFAGSAAGSEDLSLTATANMWTFASSTSAALTITPALTVTGLVTANGGAAVANVNGAGGSASQVALSGTLGAMDGAGDYFRGLYGNWTNANHSAGNVFGVDLQLNAGDADATERGVNISANWDHGIYSKSPVYVGDDTNGISISGAGSMTFAGTAAITSPILNLLSTNADPGTTAGQIKHDSTDTGSNSGGTLKWYDGAQVRSVVDTGTNYTIVTKTEFLPIRYAEDGSAAPSAAAAVTGKVIIARSFADAKDVVFFWVVPNDYIGGGAVKYRVHYALSADASADDTVTFSTTGCIIANSANIACTAGTALAVSDELGTDDDQYQYMVTDYSAESNTDWGATAGGLVKLGFSYSDGDYDNPALVIGVEIKYKAKVMGFSDY